MTCFIASSSIFCGRDFRKVLYFSKGSENQVMFGKSITVYDMSHLLKLFWWWGTYYCLAIYAHSWVNNWEESLYFYSEYHVVYHLLQGGVGLQRKDFCILSSITMHSLRSTPLPIISNFLQNTSSSSASLSPYSV